jgi:hypothetical protein
MNTSRVRSKSLIPLCILLIAAVLAGCGPSPKPLPTATLPPTDTLRPSSTPTSEPTSTATPRPTATTQPTPTPIPLPEGISDVITNAVIKVQDTFGSSFDTPQGWSACAGFEPIWSPEDGHLLIKSPADKYGVVYYYADEMIDPNEAVYFLFAYEGNEGSFTLGFDGYSNGKVCDSIKNKLGFYSVALQHLAGLPLTVHTIVVDDQPTGYFTGDWRLQEKNWYSALMGFDQSNTFFINIWKPTDPTHKLVYKQTKADFPKAYNFISWLGVSRTLMLDDFTILTFEQIK